MLAYVDVAERLDKIKTIAAFRGLFPYLCTTWQEDVHRAYLAGHEAGEPPRVDQERQIEAGLLAAGTRR